MGKKFLQGKFIPKNPEKYMGDTSKIVFRSSWERKLMIKFDTSPDIVAWSSEEIVIPYLSPIDGKMHRYYMDFWAKTKHGKEYIIEVKPKNQVEPPKKPKRVTKQHEARIARWMVNRAKWAAAKKYAMSKGMTFKIFTEETLGV